MARDVSYATHPVGGVTEHRVRTVKTRPPAVTLCLLALHGYVAWQLWQTDISLGRFRGLSVRHALTSLVSVQAVLLVFYLLILLNISHRVLYESMTVLPGLGVQVSSARRRFFQTKTRTRFVPAKQVRSIVIHEGLSKWNVHYYLGIVTGPNPETSSDDRKPDAGKIVVAFETVRPPLSVLKQVYHAVEAELRMPTGTSFDASASTRTAESAKENTEVRHGAEPAEPTRVEQP